MSDTELKKTEEIQPGDLVYSYNEETGTSDWKPVVQVFRNESNLRTTLSLDCEDKPIECTPEHPFYILNTNADRDIVRFEGRDETNFEGQWIAAKNLKIGDKCLLSNGKYGIITSVKIEQCEKFTTYNFEVADFHTYYVGEQGILVHNDCISDELARIANKYDDFKCVEAVDEMKAFLRSKGINPEQVQIQFSGVKGRNFVYSETLGRTISYNGYHTGIVYKGMVYDNLFKTGLAYNSWIDDFLGFGTRTIF